MDTPGMWRKSSYSGGGEGNACVEVADRHTLIAIRDSKAPTRAALSFPPTTFSAFIEAVKTQRRPPQESSEKGDSMPPQWKL
ncbi:DUF397 domain-containing protein [Streptomyces aquilus]|uniref:DUF397 domain-containing protein n=1 Tax=Streptomyces aquilus TaxID=2548456 RepID=UPI0036CB0139